MTFLRIAGEQQDMDAILDCSARATGGAPHLVPGARDACQRSIWHGVPRSRGRALSRRDLPQDRRRGLDGARESRLGRLHRVATGHRHLGALSDGDFAARPV
ncbi:hypothetical protein PSCLAVI8L_130467 [Pseudoclavibacter sp. 8L]|nr:hypothetical protein PSCLAVI8L_130467 [Pseudoclavibacter sp. 8L]